MSNKHQTKFKQTIGSAAMFFDFNGMSIIVSGYSNQIDPNESDTD